MSLAHGINRKDLDGGRGPARAEPPTFLTVNYLHPRKRVGLIIEAFARLFPVADGQPIPRLVVVGSGPERQELEELAANLDVADHVDFAGFVASQQPSPRDKGEQPHLDILSMEIAGSTAAARVRDEYLGLRFLDTLSLLKTDGKWSIYNKLFHVEGEAG